MKRNAGEMQPFRMGVNYWPRSSAMQMWRRFDLGEVAEDFARIREFGFDVVRFFLDWEAFAPEPFATDRDRFRHFASVLDAARTAGLLAIPTLFAGHMFGVNWLPAWTLDRRVPASRYRTISGGTESPHGAGDIYTGELLEAQRWFARRLGVQARDDETVLAWDLGHDFSRVREPARESEAAHWSAALTHDLYDASNRPATGGLSGRDLTHDTVLRLSTIAEPWEFVSMHDYSTSASLFGERAGPESVAFLAELAGSFSGKPVLVTGLGHFGLDESETAVLAKDAIGRLRGCGAIGALFWCWTDFAESLASEPPFDRAPLEMRAGIVRADGTEKPVAAALRALARERTIVSAITPRRHVDEHSYYRALPESTDAAIVDYRAANTPSAGAT